MPVWDGNWFHWQSLISKLGQMNKLMKELMYKLFAQYYVPNTPNSLNLKTQFNLKLLFSGN